MPVPLLKAKLQICFQLQNLFDSPSDNLKKIAAAPLSLFLKGSRNPAPSAPSHALHPFCIILVALQRSCSTCSVSLFWGLSLEWYTRSSLLGAKWAAVSSHFPALLAMIPLCAWYTLRAVATRAHCWLTFSSNQLNYPLGSPQLDQRCNLRWADSFQGIRLYLGQTFPYCNF